MPIDYIGTASVSAQTRYCRTLYDELRKEWPRIGYSVPDFPKWWPRPWLFRNYLAAVLFARRNVMRCVSKESRAVVLGTPGMAGAIPSIRGKGKKAIVFLYDLIPLTREEFRRGRVLRFEANRTFPRVREADCVVSISEWTKREAVELLGVDAKRITVIPYGVDRTVFRPADIPKKEQVLYVGSEQPRKNIPGLLRAFARVKKAVPGATLLKVGGPQWKGGRERTEDLIRELGLTGSVNLVGDVSDDSLLARYYSESRVLVFPTYSEGFGLPPLEAMACGTPVVASNATSLPEVVGDAGILAGPDDTEALAEGVIRVLTDEAAARDLSRRGLERSRMFDWAEGGKRLAGLLRGMVG